MKKTLFIVIVLFYAAALSAQTPPDRKEVRSGNRDFKKGDFREADIDYRRALIKDSTSVAANYNLANTLYRQGDYEQAKKYIEQAEPASSADVWFNKGDIALQNKDYNTAVEAFKQSLLLEPNDIDAKKNYVYAKRKLQEQQQNQDQNQQNQQNQDQNQDKNQDQNQNKDQNKDQQDQNKDQQNQDQNKNQQDQNKDQNQDKQPQGGQQPQLSPQAAQQMLDAVQAKEKDTQEKVKEEKAALLKSRQKEKNW